MKTNKKKLNVEELSGRRPWQRLDETAKSKVVRDVIQGRISYREASRKYSLARNTIKKWVSEVRIEQLLKSKVPALASLLPSEMRKDDGEQLLREQIKMLTKELENAKLKAMAFETMIIVAEDEYKIKIRKKEVVVNNKE